MRTRDRSTSHLNDSDTSVSSSGEGPRRPASTADDSRPSLRPMHGSYVDRDGRHHQGRPGSYVDTDGRNHQIAELGSYVASDNRHGQLATVGSYTASEPRRAHPGWR